jgi:UDP-glucuronate 4-epimerase
MTALKNGRSRSGDRPRDPLKVLVTGAAGFIGSHLCERLLEDGQQVWGLDNFDPFYAPAIKRGNVRGLLGHSHMRLIEGDIRDGVLLDGLFSDVEFDVVIHLAARPGVRPSIEEPEECFDVNVQGTLTLLEAMRRHHVDALIFGSSSSVYGDSDTIPLEESARADRPISPYAASKRAGEHICHTFHHLYGISVHCLRFFTVFGPRQRPDLAIHKFARLMTAGKPLPLYGDGTTARDYTYVADTVEGVVRSMDRLLESARSEPAFEVINLGRSDSVTLVELVDGLSRSLGIEPEIEWLPMQPGDVTVTCASDVRAKSLLGFEPRVDLETGLARFVEWFRRNRTGGDAVSEGDLAERQPSRRAV